MIIDMEVRDGVLQIDDAFYAGAIHAVAQSAERPANHSRVPGNRPAVLVHGTSELRIGRGAIKIRLHLVLARPGELHRLANGLRNLDGLSDIFHCPATSKSAP